MEFSSNRSEDICTLLKRVANQVSRIRGSAGPENPAAGMGVILSLLAEGHEMNQLELANALQIRSASLSETILKLEARGYVARKKNPHDRRARLVTLTPKGVEAEKLIRRERQHTSDAILSVLTDEECDALYALLKKLSTAYIEGRMRPEEPGKSEELRELLTIEGERGAYGRKPPGPRKGVPPERER